jgi:hypothetical protein
VGSRPSVERLLHVPVAQPVDLHHHQPAPRFARAGEGLLAGAAFDAVLVERAFFVQFQDAGEDGVEEGEDDAAQQPCPDSSRRSRAAATP